MTATDLVQLYGKKSSNGQAKAIEVTDDGELKIDPSLGLATQTTLADILAKLTADPATQTTLAAILAKIIAAPATEAKQDTGNGSLASLVTALGEVAASPTENTVLDRLKDIASALASVGVTGPLTDTELRAADVKITMDSEVVQINGAGASQTNDLKVTLDSETVTITDPLPDTTGDDLAGIHSAADTIAGAISSSRMQVDLKGTKGSVVTAHNGITETATSAEIDCSGYNALLVETIVSVAVKNWTVKVTGCLSTGGTFGDCYEGATLMSYQTNSSRIAIWKGVPNFVKIVATEDEDTGTCTVRVQPLNV